MGEDIFNQKFKLAIMGAGPAGVEAALQAKKLGITSILIEKEKIGSLFNHDMSQKTFHRAYGNNTSTIKGDLLFPDRAKGSELAELWKGQTKDISYIEGAQMISLTRDGDMVIETTQGKIKAENVIIATGAFESPKKLHVIGEMNNSRILYNLDYSKNYEGQNIIVVGGGNSAAETVINLSNYNQITMLVRGKDLAESVTENNRKEIISLANERKINLIFEERIREIKENGVITEAAAGEKKIPYDLVFVHIGYEKPVEFLKSLGIKVDENSNNTKPIFNERFETNIPSLFVAGSITGADSIIESANQAFDIVSHINTK